ncbi:MAG TPA: SIR2 family protein, partial [Tepidisphaeraceae bacterium]
LQAVPKPYRLVNTPQKLHEDRKNLDVIKFHGDLNASESMVFAESGYYDRMRFDHPFDVLLRADCLQSSLLFLGYSFNDVNIRFLWNRLWESFATRSGRRDATCRAYLCVVGDAHIARNCLCADGISVIGLNPVSPTQSLRKLLNEIVDAQ